MLYRQFTAGSPDIFGWCVCKGMSVIEDLLKFEGRLVLWPLAYED